MKRSKIITQLESELVAANAAIADIDRGEFSYSGIEPAFFDGYWIGRRFGLEETLTLLKDPNTQAKETNK